MADEIDEILKFDPGLQTAREEDEIDEILKFDPAPGKVGGTRQPIASPFPGGTPPIDVHTGKPITKYYPGSEPDASFGTMMEAGLVDDPITQVQIYAKNRGIPVSEIPKRYRIKDGNIEFKADSGQWQREVLDFPTQKIKRGVAGVLSHPSTYMGAAGAIVGGAPGAVVGAMAGEETRRLIGKHQYNEPQEFTDRLIKIGLEGALALAGEGVDKVVRGGINRFLSRKAKGLKYAGKEALQSLLSTEEHAKALFIKGLADQHGIRLGPHQLYNKAGMINTWKYLRKHPQTSDAIQKFETELGSQTEDSIKNFITKMGGAETGSYQIGEGLKLQAAHTIETAEGARRAAAKPYYDKAFDKTPEIDTGQLVDELRLNKDTISRIKIDEKPDIEIMVKELNKAPKPVPTMKIKGEDQASYVERITKDYERITGKPTPTKIAQAEVDRLEGLKQRNEDIGKVLEKGKPIEGIYTKTKTPTVNVPEATAEIDRLLGETVKGDPSYAALSRIKNMIKAAGGDPRKLDRIKRSGIDNVLNKTKTNRTLTRELTLVKKQLTDAMDAQIPDYKTARATYEKLSRPIDKLKDSIIGELANLSERQIPKATRRLFSSGAMPDAKLVKQARKILYKQDPELWNKSVAEYISSTYNELMETETGEVVNVAGKLRKRLFGSKHKREIMAAAFGGAHTKEFRSFNDLMDVFQRAAIGTGGESMTAQFQAIERGMGGLGSRAYDFAKRPKDFLVDKVFGWWNDAIMTGHQEALLKAITAPDVQVQISKIKRLTPKSAKFIEGMTVLGVMVSNKIGKETLPETPEGQIALPGQP